ncbi:MAG: GNAT family N-acetyltransferase [Acidobacteriia bacterium]|nr:GNAT family N-acetyltransferase [Terriglobia bacterium]
MRDFQIVDSNLRAAMRFFGDATGAGEIHSLDGAMAIYSGLDYGVFNIALLEGHPPEGIAGFTERLSRCARYFAPRTMRWSFWLCEDALDTPTRRQARALLMDRDLRPISQAPGMLAESLAPPVRPLPKIECLPVADRATRQAFGALTAVSFDIPMKIAKAVYEPERAWFGEYRGFVGFAAGKPVAIVAIVATPQALGVYSLSTLPECRRLGYGEALLRAAVASEQQRTGTQRVVLQSTDAGYSLYRRLGFNEVAKFSVYLTR